MKPEDLRIVETPTLVRDHALEKLRGAITTGLYPPGTRLVERELCEALGVSRTSVREALRQLQSEQLVEVGPRRNIRVAVISARDAEDIYAVREMLETLAVRRFVELSRADALKRLERIYREVRRAFTKDDTATLARVAGAFYQTILSGAGSRVIYDVALQVLARVDYLRFRSISEPGRVKHGMAEIDAIMSAVRAGDADAAALAMSAHLRNSREAVVARLLADEHAKARCHAELVS